MERLREELSPKIKHDSNLAQFEDDWTVGSGEGAQENPTQAKILLLLRCLGLHLMTCTWLVY